MAEKCPKCGRVRGKFHECTGLVWHGDPLERPVGALQAKDGTSVKPYRCPKCGEECYPPSKIDGHRYHTCHGTGVEPGPRTAECGECSLDPRTCGRKHARWGCLPVGPAPTPELCDVTACPPKCACPDGGAAPAATPPLVKVCELTEELVALRTRLATMVEAGNELSDLWYTARRWWIAPPCPCGATGLGLLWRTGRRRRVRNRFS